MLTVFTVTDALVLPLLLEVRGRITVSPYPDAPRQNRTVMFSVHETVEIE